MEPSSFTTLTTETDAVDDRRSYEYWENGNELADDQLGDDEFADDLDADLELVVLDLAGTVIVDDGLVERAVERALQAAGIGETPDDWEDAIDYVRLTAGLPKISVFRDLADDEDQAQHANAAFESAYSELATEEGVSAVPGAEQLILRLRAAGVKVAMTTSLSRATQDVLLDQLGWHGLADLTLSAAEAGRGRPYPDLPLTALLRTGTSSVEGMVVVGDTASDIASGIAAGAGLVVGVLSGADDEDTLLDAGADAVIPSIADLAELLGFDVDEADLDDADSDEADLDDADLDDDERDDSDLDDEDLDDATPANDER
ncbi:HAD family hydrolase [Leifsonia sp. NPDC058248]|uniref:HAD family hydrolase n=1 Tax=Leifsonia sp. NPDC058248 TaxID=3346402 RepID=UPI0036DC93E1